jgi:hypothetical protein
MDPSELVQPVAPEAAPAPAEAPPPMPEALLKIPAISGLLTGNPGAFSLPIKESKSKEDLQDLAKHKDWLQRAGMAVYGAGRKNWRRLQSNLRSPGGVKSGRCRREAARSRAALRFC